MNEIELLRAAAQLEQNTATMDMARARIEALEAALRKITDLIDSEADDPLDDAIRIARAALAPDLSAGCGRAVTEPWNDVAQTPRQSISFMEAMNIVEIGFNTWKSKEHNAKWWKRIDGTPIPNDLMVNIAEAISHHAAAQAPFHPDSALPGCMMPDGGECCVGYQALLADWRRLRAAAQDQLTEVNIRRQDV